jgi:hypothetical protein
MYIDLFGSSDRLGGNIADMISQIIYAVKNKIYIKYDSRQTIRVYNGGYRQYYNNSIFIQTLFDIIDKHNSTISNETFSEYLELAAPSHFEVLSKTTLNVSEDLFSYFKNNLYTDEIKQSFFDKAKNNNYTIPFDTKKTILVHLRLEDVRDREDYDGRPCVNYMKNKIENGEIPNNEVLTITEPSPWCQMQAPIPSTKIKKIIEDILIDKPEHKVVIITNPNENITDLPYEVISSNDEFYDLFLLCNTETVVLSKSNYALSSLFFGNANDVHIPLWGHIPCYGLYTKYDKTNFKYFY